MGIFKDDLNLGLQYAFLINLGFKYEESNGINGMSGYVKSINHNEIEVLWITVNPQERKVHLYNEWDCGGELWQREYDIPQNVLECESKFVDWLDEMIGDDLMDNKQIYDALMTLKECCKNSECSRCPLSVGKNPYKCKVADNENGFYPKDWELNNNFDYKAFER